MTYKSVLKNGTCVLVSEGSSSVFLFYFLRSISGKEVFIFQSDMILTTHFVFYSSDWSAIAWTTTTIQLFPYTIKKAALFMAHSLRIRIKMHCAALINSRDIAGSFGYSCSLLSFLDMQVWGRHKQRTMLTVKCCSYQYKWTRQPRKIICAQQKRS